MENNILQYLIEHKSNNISLIAIFIDLSNGDLAVDDEICLGNRISISSREHSALRWRLLNHQH